MSGRSRRPGSNLRAVPWRTALLATALVCLIPWEISAPPVADAAPAVVLEGQAPSAPGSAPAGMQMQPAEGEAPSAAAPAEVLGGGPDAPAVIEATPTSFSDATH